ncbi:unnamed protein product [Closterium sp. Naga37s-1]|nr:unnamed protein product [Closterium sp. Naga37s-1]
MPTRTRVGEWEAHRGDYEGMKEEDDEADEPDVPSFPALEAAVDAAIARLGGSVLPKLNWSCPKVSAAAGLVLTFQFLLNPYYEGMKAEDDEADEPDVPSFPALEAAVDAAIARLGGFVLPKLNWSCPKVSAAAGLVLTFQFLLNPYYEGMKEEDDEADEPDVPSFPALEAAVDAAIARLGGFVLPKLNWSCPKDVGWLSATGTPKCSNAQEVFLLLKASDSLTYDLCHAFDSCVDSSATDDSSKVEPPANGSEPASDRSNGGASVAATEADGKQQERNHDGEMNGGAEARQEQQVDEVEQHECGQQSRPSEFVLALRKWFDLRPEMEFRCFVKARRLIGISQREITSFYPFLVDSHENLKLQILCLPLC